MFHLRSHASRDTRGCAQPRLEGAHCACLDAGPELSAFALGVAPSRCSDGYCEGTKSIPRCVYRKQLDIDTIAFLSSSLAANACASFTEANSCVTVTSFGLSAAW